MSEATKFCGVAATGHACAPVLAISATIAALVLGSAPVRAEDGWSEGRMFDAIVVGRERDGTLLQVCRVRASPSEIVPGKLAVDGRTCLTPIALPPGLVFETLSPSWTSAEADAGSIYGREADGRPLGVCRAPLEVGGFHLGKKLSGVDACSIPYGNAERWLPNYEVLSRASPFAVEEAPGVPLPDTAIIGGFERDGTPLFPCIASLAGGSHPGKTRRGWNACAVSYGDREHWVTDFRVLVPVFRSGEDDLARLPIAQVGRLGSEPLGVCVGELEGALQVGVYSLRARNCLVGVGAAGQTLRVFRTLRSPASAP